MRGGRWFAGFCLWWLRPRRGWSLGVPWLAEIQLRHGTAAEWTAANTLLLVGELGFEKDTGKFKIGDGVTHWIALSYAGGGPFGTSYVFFGASTSYTLPSSGFLGQRIAVKDDAGTAESINKTVHGSIDGGSSLVLNQNYAAREFVWNGTNWSAF